jgi:hypothetical protein
MGRVIEMIREYCSMLAASAWGAGTPLNWVRNYSIFVELAGTVL